jgi:carboxy-terminal domain RNA polymerase II polypeptide A small phosphatase
LFDFAPFVSFRQSSSWFFKHIMPTKAEMLAFFRKFRTDEGGQQEATVADEKRQATESAQLLSNALCRAERPPAGAAINVHPPSLPQSNSFRQRQIAASGSVPISNRPPDAGMPAQMPNLGPASHQKVTLILDVDETLVHSSFRAVPTRCDLEISIVVNGNPGTVYVKKRPYLEEFLAFVASRFEVVIFTASLGIYCNPLVDILDPDGKLDRKRLFREHCTKHNGAYIKDLSLLGRNMDRIAIVDNSPVAYYFQPRNAIPILSWFDDPSDQGLLELLPMLGQLASCKSVYDILDPYNEALIQKQNQNPQR